MNDATHAGPFLEIDGLRKTFGALDALKDISIDVEEGGFLVLVGPSGCGKSTLLNMLAGFEEPSDGDIRIGGRSVAGLHPSRRDIAMVFQSYALYPNMTVEGNIGFGMETRGIPKAERAAKTAEIAAMLQIEHLLKRKPSQLSGGQRQRVAMGRALVRDPQVFLFDEPLSNLDARLRVDMRTEIKKLHARLGTTIVYVTHDQIEAMTLATRIAVLKLGELQQIGTPDEIYHRPANTFVADFMGSPAMNRIEGRLQRDEGTLAFVADGLRLPIASPSPGLAERDGSPVHFGIRAEDLTDTDSASPASNGLHPIERTVEVVEPTGADTYVITRDGNASLTARIRHESRLRSGERVTLTCDMERAHWFDPDTGHRIE